MKKKWSSGKIAVLIMGVICAGVILTASLCVSIYQLTKFAIAWDEFETAYNGQNDENFDEAEESSDKEQSEDQAKEKNEHFADVEYYEFHNEIRDDLSYQVSLENFRVEAENGLNAAGTASYPVITGEHVRNIDLINDAIHKEMDIIKEHVNLVAEQMPENQSYLFEAECYITYMDEELFSIAYVEYGYLDGERQESYVASVNIDMDNGMVMTNTQLLNIDDDFSIEFRKRSDRQNGENELLDYYSDQNFTEMMNEESSLIIFYTPIGMEVGFNHYYGWVTVTYPDYKKYQNPL